MGIECTTTYRLLLLALFLVKTFSFHYHYVLCDVYALLITFSSCHGLAAEKNGSLLLTLILNNGYIYLSGLKSSHRSGFPPSLSQLIPGSCTEIE